MIQFVENCPHCGEAVLIIIFDPTPRAVKLRKPDDDPWKSKHEPSRRDD